MPRLWVLPALGLIAVLGFTCGDSGDDQPQSVATGTPTASPTPTSANKPSPAPSVGSGSATQTPPPNTSSLDDPDFGYSVHYPDVWQTRQVTGTKDIPDFESAVEFMDKQGTVRASVYVFANPDHQTLREWIAAHDSITAEATLEDEIIGGNPALVARVNFEGRPSPLAYFELGAHVIGLKGLGNDDFNAVASGFRTRSE
jgi:hypothetical protein